MKRRGPWVWLALVVPVWLAMVLCTHWEPILRDGWGHYFWHRERPITLHAIWRFAHDTYLHGNPRLGQTWTMLLATPGPWHSIVTPLVEVLMFVQLTALALGRWPSPRRTDDALVFAAILALVVISAPQIGPMLFYRPFTGNYTFGFVICLAFALPYRFDLARAEPRERRWWWGPIMLVAGVAAGLSNEHTAPACAAVAGMAAVVAWRRGRLRAWMIAGIIGVIAGGLALYLAPGQAVRYDGLATRASAWQLVRTRGLGLDLAFAFAPLYFARWIVVGFVALLVVRRRRGGPAFANRGFALALIATAFAIAFTLLVSPKVGRRLYFAPACLLAVAVATAVVPLLAARRLRVAAWGASAAAIAYALVICVHTYAIVGRESAERIAEMANAPKGAVVEVAPYSLPESRWFLGEDFVAPGDRARLAHRFGLASVRLTAPAECAGCRMTLADPPRRHRYVLL